MWSILKVEYSALKRKEILTHAMTCMNLEDIMPSELSYLRTDRYCRIPFYEVSKAVRFTEIENRMVVTRGYGRGKGEKLSDKHRVSYLQDETFWRCVSQQREYTQCY